MTKHIRHALILAAILFTLLPASAVRYRGFVEASGGKAFLDGSDFLTDSFSDTWTCSFLTTHGIQYNNLLFIGVGIGSQLQRYEDSGDLYLIYSNIHLDFDSYKKTHPYLDFKLGIYKGFTYRYIWVEPNKTWNNMEENNTGYPYLSLGFGYRIKMFNFSGLNIGLSLNTGPHLIGRTDDQRRGVVIGKRIDATDINLNLGIDF